MCFVQREARVQGYIDSPAMKPPPSDKQADEKKKPKVDDR
jgi:hypothetical protein